MGCSNMKEPSQVFYYSKDAEGIYIYITTYIYMYIYVYNIIYIYLYIQYNLVSNDVMRLKTSVTVLRTVCLEMMGHDKIN